MSVWVIPGRAAVTALEILNERKHVLLLGSALSVESSRVEVVDAESESESWLG